MSEALQFHAQDDGLFFRTALECGLRTSIVSFVLKHCFSTGMKSKWDTRVYIDLFAGSGMVRVRDTKKFLWGSPLLALQLADPFDKYIFCESNSTALGALQSRVARLFSSC